MAKIANSLISLYQSALPLCEPRKIALNLDLADPTLTIDLDQATLTKQLMPHLHSAITRTPRNGTITLGAYREGKTISIFIKDTGEAIPRSDRTTLTAEHPRLRIHSRHGYGTTITLDFHT